LSAAHSGSEPALPALASAAASGELELPETGPKAAGFSPRLSAKARY